MYIFLKKNFVPPYYQYLISLTCKFNIELNIKLN